ncbi:uncharacterized protein B0J16DRAFT_329203 [Fusarium flagelliforme]|uniref:uncharacterized protein n=1 Tax=Fusarium flagelliforme TaxID=2675880 RepID=UPI001E8D3F8B|nr:uncharacterized protein B0J16DRAFT_329203 [Fusarium flagelliforme]KAH7197833.1 hypothetical protein B0J16DRAFT_329203 [Fusarium flagelliforme]
MPLFVRSIDIIAVVLALVSFSSTGGGYGKRVFCSECRVPRNSWTAVHIRLLHDVAQLDSSITIGCHSIPGPGILGFLEDDVSRASL